MNNFQGLYEDKVVQEYLDVGSPGFWVAQWPKSNTMAKNDRNPEKMQKMEVWNSENPCSHMV